MNFQSVAINLPTKYKKNLQVRFKFLLMSFNYCTWYFKLVRSVSMVPTCAKYWGKSSMSQPSSICKVSLFKRKCIPKRSSLRSFAGGSPSQTPLWTHTKKLYGYTDLFKYFPNVYWLVLGSLWTSHLAKNYHKKLNR